MKAAKWLKWKIGAACAVLLVVLLQFVRSSPQFDWKIDQTAAAKVAPDQANLSTGDQGDVMREWQDQDRPADDAYQGSSTRPRRIGRHRDGGFGSDDGNGSDAGSSGFGSNSGSESSSDSGQNSQSQGNGFDTRASRS